MVALMTQSLQEKGVLLWGGSKLWVHESKRKLSDIRTVQYTGLD